MVHRSLPITFLISCLLINFSATALRNLIDGKHPYENNEHTTELMQCPVGNIVKIKIIELELECHFDHLTLIESDGTHIFDSKDNYCSLDSGSVFYSTTSNVTMKFDSDPTVTRAGYKIAWECKACGFHKYTEVKSVKSCEDGDDEDCVNIKVIDGRGGLTISLKTIPAGAELQLSSVVDSQGDPLPWKLASNWTSTSKTTVVGPLCRPCSNHTQTDDDEEDDADVDSDGGCFLVSDGEITDSVGDLVQCHSHESVREGQCIIPGCHDCLSDVAVVAIVFFFLLGLCICTGLCIWACLKAKQDKGFDVELASRTSKARRTTRVPPEDDEPRVTLTPLPAATPTTPTPAPPPRASHTPTSPVPPLSFSTPTSSVTTATPVQTPVSKEDLISI